MSDAEKRRKEMQSHFSFLDNLGVALLVTDPESKEVLFANDAMNRSYGVQQDPVGKTCYEAYGEDPSSECGFCPMDRLLKNPEQPIVWERYHPKVQKWFRHADILTRWLDGHRIHIQSVADITHEKEEELSAARQKAQHELMASITRDFALLSDNVYGQIYHAFEKTGAFLEIDRILLLKRIPGTQEVAIECAWFKRDSCKPERMREALPQLDFGRYGKGHKEYIACENVSESSQFAALKAQGVESFLAVPVWTTDADTRFISFETCERKKRLESPHVHLATILGDIVGNALIRVADTERINMARRQAQTLLDATPFSCVLFDEEQRIVDCNLYALRNSGFETKAAFIESFMLFAPKSQEDGKASGEFLRAQFAQAMEKGSVSFRWDHANTAGDIIPLQITMVRVPWDAGFRIAAYSRSLLREFAELEKRRIAEKQIQVMLDSTPLICSMWDEQLSMIDCNLAAVRLLGMDDKSEYIGHFYNFNPTYQPDGEPSKAKAARWLKKVLKTGREERFEWEYLTRTGQLIPAETTLIRVDWDNEYRILAYSQDLREIRAAESKKKEAEQRTLLMLDTLPMASYLIARNHALVDCNREAVRMFQAKDKEHLIHSFLEDFSPDYQPDGQPSAEKANQYIDRAFSDGYVVFDWTHKMPNGDMIPAEIILVRVQWKENEDLVCAYTRDLRRVKRAEGELRQKTLLLETVNRIAERLLPTSPANIDHALSLSMKYLANSVNVDAVRIWENTEENGKSCYYLAHSWPQALESLSGEAKPYDDLPYWRDMVFSNRIINGPVRDLPSAERSLLSSLDVRSVFVIPLTILDKVWGFVSFEDHRHVRVLTESEEHALRSGSTILASALHRNDTTKELIGANIALTKNKNLLSAVNRVAELILSSEREDFPRVIQKSLGLIGESVGADRASLWENHPGKDGVLYANRLPGWKKGWAFENCEYALTIPLYDYVPEWKGEGAPQDIEFIYDEMNEKLQGMDILEGGKYLLLIPLYLQESFWGFVGIAHRTEGLHFSQEDRDIIRSGSLMMAEAIIRNSLSANLQEVEVLAATDALTGLMNRASFLPKAEALFSESKLNGSPICVMFLDIDHFKRVNDNYGHMFGDTVLVHMAAILKSSIRPHDLCARYGGEEFVIVLAEGSTEAAEKVAGRIMRSLADARFAQYPEFSFTVSIGLMSDAPRDEDTLQLYIERADLALYNAKNTGRNRMVHYYDMAKEA